MGSFPFHKAKREAEQLPVVAQSRQSVLAPAISPRTGLVVAEVVPRVAVVAVVLADRAPLALAEVWPPPLPWRRICARFVQTRFFRCSPPLGALGLGHVPPFGSLLMAMALSYIKPVEPVAFLTDLIRTSILWRRGVAGKVGPAPLTTQPNKGWRARARSGCAENRRSDDRHFLGLRADANSVDVVDVGPKLTT